MPGSLRDVPMPPCAPTTAGTKGVQDGRRPDGRQCRRPVVATAGTKGVQDGSPHARGSAAASCTLARLFQAAAPAWAWARPAAIRTCLLWSGQTGRGRGPSGPRENLDQKARAEEAGPVGAGARPGRIRVCCRARTGPVGAGARPGRHMAEGVRQSASGVRPAEGRHASASGEAGLHAKAGPPAGARPGGSLRQGARPAQLPLPG